MMNETSILRREREYWQHLTFEWIDAAADAIAIVDSEGRLVYLNKRAEALLGRRLEELKGKSFQEFIPSPYHDELLAIWEQMCAGASFPYPFEIVYLAPDGRQVPVEISLTPLRIEGSIEGLFVVARDVQEHKRQLAQSQQSTQALSLAFHHLSLALASHNDPQTVLNLITRSAAELLEAELSILWLVEPDNSEWLAPAAVYFAKGETNQASKPIARTRVGDGFAGRIIAEMRPICLLNVPALPDLPSPPMETPEQEPASYMYVGVPLTIQNSPSGVLAVACRRRPPFSGLETDLLSSFASLASVGIERARLHQRLVEERDELEAIVQNSADGILVLDQHKQIVDVNPALEQMLGYTRDQLIGRHCWDLLHPSGETPSACDEKCPFNPRWAGVKSLLFSHELRNAQGRPLTVSTSYGIVRNNEGHIVKIIAIMRDMTKQTELDRLRNDFVSSVTHELRTPLALIKGYIGTLLRPDVSITEELRQRFLKGTSEAADRLERLIEDLLTVSQIGTGRLAIERKRHDLVRLTKRVAEQASIQFPAQHIELRLSNEPLYAMIDAGRIEQVLSNLISNAVKFSPPGQPVIIQTERIGHFARISVTDRGAGIAPEYRERIFEKFYRVESALVAERPGLGLGLYIAKCIIDAHGGRIWVESRLGEGSTFGFDLALIAPNEEEQTHHGNSLRANGPSQKER